MLILGILLILVGAVVAVTVHHTLGLVLAVIGIALVIWAVLVTADAEAAMLAAASWR